MKELKSVIALTLIVTVAFFFAVGTSNAAKNQPIKLEGTLNINTATVEDLVLLPGIGEKTAGKIVEYRTKNEPFKEVDDLVKVKGIGEKKLNTIKTFLAVEGKNTLKQVEE